MGPHYHTQNMRWGNRKVAGLITAFTGCWITLAKLHTAVFPGNINTECQFNKENHKAAGDWSPCWCLVTGTVSIPVVYKCTAVCVCLIWWKLFPSVTALNGAWYPSGSLPMELQEGKEPKTTTNATMGSSYLPYFLWRKEICFTSWWATRERMRARGWVGWAWGQAQSLQCSYLFPGKREMREWPR